LRGTETDKVKRQDGEDRGGKGDREGGTGVGGWKGRGRGRKGEEKGKGKERNPPRSFLKVDAYALH